MERRESFHQLLRDELLHEIRQEQPPEGRGAAFVADDEAAAMDVADDLFPVVMAGVGAGAQDGGEARLVAAGRAGGRQQVGGVFAPDARKPLLEDAVQLGGEFQQAGRVEMDLVHVREGLDRVREDGRVGLRRNRGSTRHQSVLVAPLSTIRIIVPLLSFSNGNSRTPPRRCRRDTGTPSSTGRSPRRASSSGHRPPPTASTAGCTNG